MLLKATLTFFTIVPLFLASPGTAFASIPATPITTQAGEEVYRSVLEYYGNGATASKLYIGSEACLACHPKYAYWRDTLHATGVKTTPDDANSMKIRDGVIVDYNNNKIDDFKDGLDFNRISSAWDTYKPNAPILKYDPAKGYIIRIGLVDYTVYLTHGGSGYYKQRFLVKMPVSDRPGGLSAGTYYSPVQYNEATRQYVVYEPTYWYNADRTPKFNGPVTSAVASTGKSFEKECAGCHATGLKVSKDSQGEWTAVAPPTVYSRPEDNHVFDLDPRSTNKLQFNIGCERCHGPGSAHVTELGKKENIINPANFTAKQQNYLCGGCHGRYKSIPDATFDYPWDTKANEGYAEAIGEDLYERFVKDANGVYGDSKTSRQHHQQLQELMKSSKWEYQFHKVTCVECHDPHGGGKSQLRAELEVNSVSTGAKLKIPAKSEDNSLCLGCHAGFGPFAQLRREDILDLKANRERIAGVVEAHTHHPYEPERVVGLSRCTECHMAKMASSGAPYDMHSHTFEVVPPAKTLATQSGGGMPNSCAVRCHRTLSPLFGGGVDGSLTAWNQATDVELARVLQLFYGPDGIWWNTNRQP